MEILNILYNNNHITFYLIGAILVVILIFVVISSMSTTPKKEKKEDEVKTKILNDPTESTELNEEKISLEIKELINEETKEIPKINDIVENIYNKTINTNEEVKSEPQDLNSFLQEFEVPSNIIEEVIETNENEVVKTDLKEANDNVENKQQNENIEDMLKRLYNLRQNENNIRKTALLNEIYDLKKQVDETLKRDTYNYSLNYNEIDAKALADYYLFNEDIEFPKLK